MLRILLICMLLTATGFREVVEPTGGFAVEITNRKCVLDIAIRNVSTTTVRLPEYNPYLALWISPVDVVGPIQTLEPWAPPQDGAPQEPARVDVKPGEAVVQSLDVCGHAKLVAAGTYGITAVFDGMYSTAGYTWRPLADYSSDGAVRGTAVLSLTEADLVRFTIPRLEVAEVAPPQSCIHDEPAPSSRPPWLIIASGGLLAVLALFVLARRRVDTFIV